jgi:hypothetical protein
MINRSHPMRFRLMIADRKLRLRLYLETNAVAISKWFPCEQRDSRQITHSSPSKAFYEHFPLQFHLIGINAMLQVAATAGFEPRARRIGAKLGGLHDLPRFAYTIAAVLLRNFRFHNFSGQRKGYKYAHATVGIGVRWDSRQTLTTVNHFINRQLHVWRI